MGFFSRMFQSPEQRSDETLIDDLRAVSNSFTKEMVNMNFNDIPAMNASLARQKKLELEKDAIKIELKKRGLSESGFDLLAKKLMKRD